MTGVRLIRVSTRRTGVRETVRVLVYDELAEMRAAAARFTGNDPGEWAGVMGVCQTYKVEGVVDGDWVTKRQPLIVRLWRGALGSRVVTHEMSHAATELYGRTVDPEAPVGEHLHNANEVLAHLHSDITYKLVDLLYAYGYYDREMVMSA
ncbi:hypothetical protein [Microbacterium binotii]|uniref:Uncharacterized protein n=1 Tax=Microbacterium binotii TaxID=462710 RepID=A0ABN3PG75_9MICO